MVLYYSKGDKMNDPIKNISQNPVLKQQVNNFKKKKKPSKSNLLVILIVVALVVVVFFFMNSNKGGYMLPSGNSGENVTPKDKLATGSSWGDEYGYYIQTIFEEYDLIKVAFADLNIDGTPEMIVNYNDDKNDISKIVYLQNKKAVESKLFYNASFKIVYSYKDKESLWYIYIPINRFFGAYTEVERVLNDTAFDSDIKITNNSEKKNFNKNYFESNYNLLFGEINKNSFVKDFKTIVSKYDEFKKSIDEEFINVKNNAEVEGPTIELDYVLVGNYTLKFGTYMSETDATSISISEGVITIGREKYSYKVDSESALLLNNNKRLVPTENDRFVYNEVSYVLVS